MINGKSDTIELARLLDLSTHVQDEEERDLIVRAYWRALEVHAGQKRKSGEPYSIHLVSVARTVAEMKVSADAIAAALLHDSVEDTHLSVEIIRSEFNETVASLVASVSKITALSFAGEEEVQAENFRKLLLQMSEDYRVLVIKLADRLHNMQTLDYLPDSKQKRIARETMSIYAPLANRFGFGRIKWQLEDLGFKYLDHKNYEIVAQGMQMRREDRDAFIAGMCERLHTAMINTGLECTVQGRAKHLFSIHRKMVAQGLTQEEVFDQLAFRIIVNSEGDCYHALGTIHNLFEHFQGKFKDYIARPKRNGYQSLHTVVMSPGGRRLEIQIRTPDMHEVAEHGIAAHRHYKSTGGSDKLYEARPEDERMDALRQTLKAAREGDLSEDPKEFMEQVKTDFFADRILVFTPDGDLHELPVGATAVDFAYSIHTQVGDMCAGARVNGRMIPLRRPLESGEVVEILTRKNARPSSDWLSSVKSSSAKNRIRRRLREQERETALALGRDLLAREFKRKRQAMPGDEQLRTVSRSFGMDSAERMIEGVGHGTLSAMQVCNRVSPPEDKTPAILKAGEKITQLATRLGRQPQRGVRVEGHGNMLIRFAQCCSPVPGDSIVGIITRGRGISVHRQDCANVSPGQMSEERLISVDWEANPDERFLVNLVIISDDRPNLLADITSKISKLDVNITSGSFGVDEKDLLARARISIEIKNLKELARVLRMIRSVKGVQEVERH